MEMLTYVRTINRGLVVSLFACTIMAATPDILCRAAAQDYAAIVAEADRSNEDRLIDARRDPVVLLQFAGIKTGMKVLDIGAGGGYGTELIQRTVGPTGKVYTQNAPVPSERAKAAYDARKTKPVMQDVVELSRAFDDPVP